MQNGKPYEGEISLVSADITVATVSGNVVTALADGKTEIVIMVGGAEIGQDFGEFRDVYPHPYGGGTRRDRHGQSISFEKVRFDERY